MIILVTIALVGLVFLLIAAIFGGEHGLAGHDVDDVAPGYDMDHDADHGFEHAVGPSPFSLRVISLFLAAFGSAGAISHYCKPYYPLSSVVGLLGGVLCGYAGWLLMKLFWSQQASSSVRGTEMIGRVAQVKTAIPVSGVGQVTVVVKNQRFYPLARTMAGEQIEEGASVRILEFAGDAVLVERFRK